MIFGIGTDIVAVSRFEKWVKTPYMIHRFFNEKELFVGKSTAAACQHYAARFAVKEAFSKALGTGLVGFELKDVFISHTEFGKPLLCVEKTAEQRLFSLCGECNVFVSLSHEREYATATVVIETKD